VAETLAAGGEGGRCFSCFSAAAHALPHDREDAQRPASDDSAYMRQCMLLM